MRRGSPGRADPRWRVRPGPHAHVEPGGSRGRGLPARPQQQPRPSAQRVQGSGHHLRQTLTRLPLGARGASARRLRQGTHLAWLQEQSVARPPHADKLRPTTSEFGRNSGALPRDAVAAVRQDSRRPGDGPGRATRRRRCTLSTQSRREAGARWRPARAPQEAEAAVAASKCRARWAAKARTSRPARKPTLPFPPAGLVVNPSLPPDTHSERVRRGLPMPSTIAGALIGFSLRCGAHALSYRALERPRGGDAPDHRQRRDPGPGPRAGRSQATIERAALARVGGGRAELSRRRYRARALGGGVASPPGVSAHGRHHIP